MKFILAAFLVSFSGAVSLKKADLPYTEDADKIDLPTVKIC